MLRMNTAVTMEWGGEQDSFCKEGVRGKEICQSFCENTRNEARVNEPGNASMKNMKHTLVLSWIHTTLFTVVLTHFIIPHELLNSRQRIRQKKK